MPTQDYSQTARTARIRAFLQASTFVPTAATAPERFLGSPGILKDQSLLQGVHLGRLTYKSVSAGGAAKVDGPCCPPA
jgi:hypothetical protein